MPHFVSGSDGPISERLEREGRAGDLVLVQLISVADALGRSGWRPVADSEYWPCEPRVGDSFSMKGYHRDETGAESPLEYCWWVVVNRSLALSGPGAATMRGVVQCLVRRVDGPWAGGPILLLTDAPPG